MNFVLSSPKCSLNILFTNQLRLKDLDTNVPLLSLYVHVERTDKYHRNIIEVFYPQSVACRRYKVERAMHPN